MWSLLNQSGANSFETAQKDSAISSASSGPLLNSPSWKMLEKGSDLDRPEIDLMLSYHFFGLDSLVLIFSYRSRTDGQICIVF